MKVSAQYAQEHFADILTAIDTGEEVELTRPGQPSLFIAPRPSEPWSHAAFAKITALQRAGTVHQGIGDLRIEPGTAIYAGCPTHSSPLAMGGSFAPRANRSLVPKKRIDPTFACIYP
jgi:antitoxin (DNA-binding transcriptional repressor) of toxin-antitoxin stability system